MNRNDASPEVYRADVTGWRHAVIDGIRGFIWETDPVVEEGIKHGMLDYPGAAPLAVYKHYVRLYVVPAELDARCRRFSGLDFSKSGVRFRESDAFENDGVRDVLADVLNRPPSLPTRLDPGPTQAG